MLKKPSSGEKYKHYKGEIYEVIAIALQHDTLEQMVVYRNTRTKILYVRPLIEWDNEKLFKGKIVSRFQLIK